MGHRVRGALAGMLAILTVAGLLVALGVVPRGEPPTGTTPARRSPEPTSPAPRNAWPPGSPALAVKIDNVAAARPPVGLRAAELVYVEPVEGGLSRLIAVFGERRPPVVGPVRSARRTDLQLLAQFGHTALAFSGAAPELLPRIADSPVINASKERVPGAYYREGSRSAPHNLFVRPRRLPDGEGRSPSAAWRFGPAPPGGVPTGHHAVSYRSATVGFTWSPQRQRWLVSMDGTPYRTAGGERVTAGTVVIKRVPVRASSITDSADNPSPFAASVGSGRALVLRDGRAFTATWTRSSPREVTTYTTETGQPVPFAPGQTWVVLAAR